MARKSRGREDTSESCGRDVLERMLTPRYFGRAKDLPGVRELFSKGGGCEVVLANNTYLHSSRCSDGGIGKKRVVPKVPESRNRVLW